MKDVADNEIESTHLILKHKEFAMSLITYVTLISKIEKY